MGAYKQICEKCGRTVGTVAIRPHSNYTIELANGQTKEVKGYFDDAMAREIFNELNAFRQENGLNALNWNSAIKVNSDVRAIEIGTYFSHTRPNGGKFNSINNSCSGENIAAEFTSASSVMEGWKNSAGHRANMLYAGFTSCAVSVFVYYDVNEYGYYSRHMKFVQNFR